MKSVPFDLVIGRRTLKRLGGVLDFWSEVVYFAYRDRQVVVILFSQYTRLQKDQDGTDSEDFNSDCSEEDTKRDVKLTDSNLS